MRWGVGKKLSNNIICASTSAIKATHAVERYVQQTWTGSGVVCRAVGAVFLVGTRKEGSAPSAGRLLARGWQSNKNTSNVNMKVTQGPGAKPGKSVAMTSGHVSAQQCCS